LNEVARLGPKAFEQAAGFLRIANGDDPLDASAVHPESYPVVERILAKAGKPLSQIIGDAPLLRSLSPEDFTDEKFGLPTVQDIIAELEKPGRDPRPEFKTAVFKEGVHELKDLELGMVLEGVVTNVTAFGAFVDIGVHQDGLVHISQLANKFVKDPHTVVKAGDVVKIKVLEVDLKRKRIALTMRLDEQAARPAAPEPRAAAQPQQKPREQRGERSGGGGSDRGRSEPQRDRRPAAGTPGGNAGGGKRPDRGDRQDRGEKRGPREPAVMSAGPALSGALAEAFARAQAAKQQK
jgi:uncharacterized protein